MPSSFGTELAQAIDASWESRRKFAIAVKYSPQNLSSVIRGIRPPPLAHLDKWIKALGKSIDPVAFREKALLEHTPKEIRELVASLREELERRR